MSDDSQWAFKDGEPSGLLNYDTSCPCCLELVTHIPKQTARIADLEKENERLRTDLAHCTKPPDAESCAGVAAQADRDRRQHEIAAGRVIELERKLSEATGEVRPSVAEGCNNCGHYRVRHQNGGSCGECRCGAFVLHPLVERDRRIIALEVELLREKDGRRIADKNTERLIKELADANKKMERLRKAAVEVDDLARQYFTAFGGEHSDDECPQDDTCRCEPVYSFGCAIHRLATTLAETAPGGVEGG